MVASGSCHGGMKWRLWRCISARQANARMTGAWTYYARRVVAPCFVVAPCLTRALSGITRNFSVSTVLEGPSTKLRGMAVEWGTD